MSVELIQANLNRPHSSESSPSCFVTVEETQQEARVGHSWMSTNEANAQVLSRRNFHEQRLTQAVVSGSNERSILPITYPYPLGRTSVMGISNLFLNRGCRIKSLAKKILENMGLILVLARGNVAAIKAITVGLAAMKLRVALHEVAATLHASHESLFLAYQAKDLVELQVRKAVGSEALPKLLTTLREVTEDFERAQEASAAGHATLVELFSALDEARVEMRNTAVVTMALLLVGAVILWRNNLSGVIPFCTMTYLYLVCLLMGLLIGESRNF